MVAVAVATVVALQVLGLVRELEGIPRGSARTVVTAKAVGPIAPEFHVDEPERVFELAPPAAELVVDPALRAPAIAESDGVADLISLA